MTCHDFERTWNELLDARAGHPSNAGTPSHRSQCRPGAPDPAAVAQIESALLEHAAGCRTCRRVAARYQRLRQALLAWRSPPAAPADLASRILAAAQIPLPRKRYVATPHARGRRRFGLQLTIGAAAAAVALVLFKSAVEPPRPAEEAWPSVLLPAGGRVDLVRTAPVGTHALNQAVAEAREATWDLARLASEPAARISRQVYDAATSPERSPDSGAKPAASDSVTLVVPSLPSLAPDSVSASMMLQEVGDRLASGVLPLSTSARHAFGFLLKPAPAKPGVRERPPTTKGA